MVATIVRSIFDQPSAEEVRAQHSRVVEQLTTRFPDAARVFADARDGVLAFAHFPQPHWRKIRSNNPQERLNLEVRRRTDVVGIFPDRQAVILSSAPCSPNSTTSGWSAVAIWRTNPCAASPCRRRQPPPTFQERS